jgi:xylose isomerase
MLVILQDDNLITTQLEFRRAKHPAIPQDLEDIFIAHIAEMDTFTRVLTIAVNVLKNSQYKKMLKECYAWFDSAKGAELDKTFIKWIITRCDYNNVKERKNNQLIISGI